MPENLMKQIEEERIEFQSKIQNKLDSIGVRRCAIRISIHADSIDGPLANQAVETGWTFHTHDGASWYQSPSILDNNGYTALSLI